MADQYSQAHLDAMANQLGFKDYATWSAFNQHQQAMQNAPAQQPAQPAPQQPPAQTNWLQNLIQQYTPLGAAMKRVSQAL